MSPIGWGGFAEGVGTGIEVTGCHAAKTFGFRIESQSDGFVVFGNLAPLDFNELPDLVFVKRNCLIV